MNKKKLIFKKIFDPCYSNNRNKQEFIRITISFSGYRLLSQDKLTSYPFRGAS